VKVKNLTENNSTYTSNAYFIRGEWNTLKDKNALIDTGRDPVLFSELEKVYTGVGKSRVERVLLTHSHYDHTGNLKEIIRRWHPEVYAMSKSMPFPVKQIRDGEKILIGDREALVVACPGHSSDSVCFYVPAEKALFSGDTQLINLSDVNYHPQFLVSLEKLARLNIQIIFPGHGKPVTENCNNKIRESLRNISKMNMPQINLVKDKTNTSKYCWLNIELGSRRVGKIRCEECGQCAKIFSITVYPEYERKGIASHIIQLLKGKYNQLIADRVRPSAIGFWKKMNFNEFSDGNFLWEKG
jgi:glyoxylase-like metal-dependent hydrolase (beta-lactamase superfamily II)